MDRDLGELPEGGDIAKEVDAFFRSGRSFLSEGDLPSDSGEFNLSKEQEVLINKYLFDFLTDVFSSQKPMGDIRESAKLLKERFPEWKLSCITHLNSQAGEKGSELASFVQEKVKLPFVADFAKMIFEAAQKGSGASLPSGLEESEYRRYADHWGRVEQIVRAASEL